jgi:hypothetical protein
MPAELKLFKDKSCKEPIASTLGEINIEEVEFYIKNTGDFVIKDIEITSTFDAELKYHINIYFNPGDVVKCTLLFKEEGKKSGKIDIIGKSMGKP